MTIGLRAFRRREDLHLHRMLHQPFRRSEDGATTGRRRDRDGPG